jgi:hypothetical protein
VDFIPLQLSFDLACHQVSTSSIMTDKYGCQMDFATRS